MPDGFALRDQPQAPGEAPPVEGMVPRVVEAPPPAAVHPWERDERSPSAPAPRQLRVVFFVDVPHRFAGSQRSLLVALKQIGDHGVVPLAIFPGPGICVDRFRAAGIPTEIVAAPPALGIFGRKHLSLGLAGKARLFVEEILPFARQFAGLLQERGIDVVHFNTPRGIIEGGLGAKLAGCPTVLHLRGTPGFAGSFWLAAQALADRVILVAANLQDSLFPAFRSRSHLVYNGVPIAETLADRESARTALLQSHDIDLPSGVPVFVSLSSPVPFKGLHHLVEAAAHLKARGHRAVYLFAGAGEHGTYLQWLEQRRAALGLDKEIHFLGFVPEPLTVLAAADALVLPSVQRETIEIAPGKTIEAFGNEGLPRSILEAMSLGIPAIASRIAGVAEQIDDGRTGWIVPPGEPLALAHALEEVIVDPAGAQARGAAGRREAARRFSVGMATTGLAMALQEAFLVSQPRGANRRSWSALMPSGLSIVG